MTGTTAALKILQHFKDVGGDNAINHGLKVLEHINAYAGETRIIELANMLAESPADFLETVKVINSTLNNQ